jgi:hypothetical protein
MNDMVSSRKTGCLVSSGTVQSLAGSEGQRVSKPASQAGQLHEHLLLLQLIPSASENGESAAIFP